MLELVAQKAELMAMGAAGAIEVAMEERAARAVCMAVMVAMVAVEVEMEMVGGLVAGAYTTSRGHRWQCQLPFHRLSQPR